MPIIETELEIAAPADVVFDLSQDYRLRLAWDPFLRALHSESGGATGVGTRVRVTARNGMTMVAEYVAFDRPRRVAIRMASRSRLFARFAGSWSFEPLAPEPLAPEPLAPDRTRAVFRYGFETHWRVARALLDRAIAWILAREMRRRLTALKRGAEDATLTARMARTGSSESSA